jgi:DNA-binding NtrC family response regulator
VEARVIQGQTIKSQETVKYKSLSVTWDILRFPMRDASGEISGICGIAREVADRPASFQVSELLAAAPQSAAMNATLAAARLVAETNSILLLTGESGTGKDHLARYIHAHSRRSGGPFRVLNCAAVPAELAESELFGHEAGAFTGASRLKRGQTELAEGGTLLLNEVGELSRSLQAKLLTFLDTLSFTRVGGEKPVVVNARLIAATNKDLSAEVAEGRFREDLFYRLNVFTIHLPPLRERIEDIPALVGELIGELAVDMQLARIPELEPGALAKLSRYSWPGNTRELRNVLERALILSQGRSIGVNHLVLGRTEQRHEAPSAVTPGGEQPYEILADMERSFIEDALQRAHGKKEEAARLLGISRYALARHMKKYRITGR